MVISLYATNHKAMKTIILITLLGLFPACLSFSQEIATSGPVDRESALNIFIDCSACDNEYFKTNFTAVNYVNDSYDADVQVLVSSLPTGSGGEEYNIRLIGQGQYNYMKDTVVAVIPEHYTYDETRQALLDKLQLGLVPFLLKTPYSEKLTLFIDDSPVSADIKDPWKNWIFDITAYGSFASQKYAESYSLSGSFYASKITREIKIESSNYFGFNESKFSYFDDDTLAEYTMSQQDITSQNLFVKSFGDHWGLGGFASFGRSEYANLDFRFNLGPAVEYNIFSYEEASTRECRILYSLMYEHSNYNSITIYDKFQDDLFTQNLSINFSYYEPWGTLSASAGGSSYLNDLSQFSIGLGAAASLKISKGISLTFSGSIGYSQDQRSLRQGTGDLTEVITGQWQMEEGLNYSLNVGISFRFGSKNNNSVNPRFGY
jgi:hypothetical protein